MDACAPAINSELLISSYGILRLKLDPALYEWQFMDVNGNVRRSRPERLPLNDLGFRIERISDLKSSIAN